MNKATDIIKKNLLSIICGVVALIAIIALFYPLGGTTTTLEQQLQSRASTYQSLQSLQMKSRSLPVIDPDQTNPAPLQRFPNEQLIKQAEAIPEAFAKQAKIIQTAARKINEHQLLVPGSLPSPSSSTVAFEFRDAYRDMMNNGLAQFLHAGHPPTQDEITAAQQKLYNDEYKPQLVFAGGQNSGTAVNQGTVDQAFQQESLLVPARLTEKVAHTCMVYMDPATALSPSASGSLGIGGANLSSGAPSPTDIWYAQLGLWIQHDVAEAIVRTNDGFKNVIEAPVKRIVKIDVSSQPYVLPAGYQPGQPISGDPKAPIQSHYSASPTGRVSNPMYDVVHFDLTVDIEADRIPKLLDELSNGQFITVLQASVSPIDAGIEQTKGFIFGTKPIAELHLVCEEVFLSDWSNPLMPKEVAINLQGVTSVVGTGSGGGGGGGSYSAPPGMPGMPGMPGGMPPRY